MISYKVPFWSAGNPFLWQLAMRSLPGQCSCILSPCLPHVLPTPTWKSHVSHAGNSKGSRADNTPRWRRAYRWSCTRPTNWQYFCVHPNESRSLTRMPNPCIHFQQLPLLCWKKKDKWWIIFTLIHTSPRVDSAKPKDKYHPNHPSTRCIVKSLNFWLSVPASYSVQRLRPSLAYLLF